MEPESSLSCSQEAATGPYPEPDESIPHLSTDFSLHLGLPSDLFPSDLSTNNSVCILSPPCVLHISPFSSSLILSH
jgi:hypothetical protein